MGNYTNYVNEVRLDISHYGCNEQNIQPKLSIILLTKNSSERTLDRCLGSLIQQTYKDFEIIILDKDSVTFTSSILLTYQYDKRIKVYKCCELKEPYKLETCIKYITTDIALVIKDNNSFNANYLLHAINNKKLKKLPIINKNGLFNTIKTIKLN